MIDAKNSRKLVRSTLGSLKWRAIVPFLILFTSIAIPTMAATLILTEKDANRTLEIHSGDDLQVELEANPSTGYKWELVDLDNKLLSPVDKEYIRDASSFGASGRVIFYFKAIASGETQLRLVYRRPFEHSAADTKSFGVTVRIE